ncbi:MULTISPECIES: MBL fold metallo-hydrolase [Arthrobacter]|uniref:MBL fold metallo-hydrolase n=1 Tax=Arthrobacter caoxuetaonis TaxID=2886935 RepID=A0A9X1SFY0_9MICC|nr:MULTISPECIES: MBL fold metallo-hydrolase [Arthrobacter]MCC3283536.1 MBL fold metallo-hydrolase [Arthrobacter caoxuetaonis]MCC3298934.1 MBL fold metallo-hydrolase [Arthrobacter caoxuetaonis]MCC9193361.1 MBL fold metallo-hydrolase [Arthrobacter sp. zg-Y916]USQ58720.1 MBL fold metallo-hydrolase [Arthrobacter caoxuetaonis]
MSEQSGEGGTHLPVEEVVREVVIPAGVAGAAELVMDVRCYAVAQPAGIVIIDTGLPGTEDGIAAAVEALGGTFADVRDIVLTHLHMDHVGSLFAVAERAPHAAIYAGGPDSMDIRAPRRVTPISEGAVIQDFGVLATPGHTKGHVSLFHEPTGTLFMGDAAGTESGEVIRGPEAFTADAALAEESLERIADLGPDRILFAHGAEVASPADALARMVGGPYRQG